MHAHVIVITRARGMYAIYAMHPECTCYIGAVLAFSIIATPNSTLLLMLLSYFSTQKSAISKVYC